MKNLVLIGAGGYFSSVVDSIRTSTDYNIIGVTDPFQKSDDCDVKVLGTDDELKSIYDSGVRYAHITVGCIGNYSVRKRLVNRAKEIGFQLVTIIDRTACVSKYVELGEMTYVAKNAVVNSTVRAGNYCIFNSSSVVEHGCVLGDFVHIAPCAAVAADITIGSGTHIGINATIRQGVTIGTDVMVGAGSIVLCNVGNNMTVYGVVNNEHKND